MSLIFPFFVSVVLFISGAEAIPSVFISSSNTTILGTSTDGVDSFLNIRYGASTAGLNRFAPPVPFIYPQSSIVNSSIDGLACPQPSKNFGFGPLIQVGNTSEDCLNLKIARPAKLPVGQKLPVMLYLYGGGFQVGADSILLYDPTRLVLQSLNNSIPVIYVGINYRGGIYGFAATQALYHARSLNVGLRDQRLALEWIQQNIPAFGGDPNQVTLFGESGGAFSVGLQITAFGGKQGASFQKAIAQSGTATSDQGIASNISASLFTEVASKLNCTFGGNADSDSTLSCMRAIPVDVLTNASAGVANIANPPTGLNTFIPTVDGDFIPFAPSTLLATGQIVALEALIQGWNSNEGPQFVPSSVSTTAAVASFIGFLWPGITNASLSELLSLYPPSSFPSLPSANISSQYYRAARIFQDLTFTCTGIHTAQAVASKGARVYTYELNQTAFGSLFAAEGFPQIEAFGSSHASDIPYVFNNVALVPGTSASDLSLGSQVSASWALFANSGSPARQTSTRHQRGQDALVDWPEAFGRADNANETRPRVRIIGGPSPGVVRIPAPRAPHNSSADAQVGGFTDVWRRCEFIWSIQDELQV